MLRGYDRSEAVATLSTKLPRYCSGSAASASALEGPAQNASLAAEQYQWLPTCKVQNMWSYHTTSAAAKRLSSGKEQRVCSLTSQHDGTTAARRPSEGFQCSTSTGVYVITPKDLSVPFRVMSRHSALSIKTALSFTTSHRLPSR